MKIFAAILLVSASLFCNATFAGDTAQMRAVIKSIKAAGGDASAFEAMLARMEKDNASAGVKSTEAKDNHFETLGYDWMVSDCGRISDMQFITMCTNANVQYNNYIAYIGTEHEVQAYKVHQAAAKTTVQFYERTK